MEHLQVIDTVSLAGLESVRGDTVFTMIPQHNAIQKLTHVNKTLMLLYALEVSQEMMAEEE
jgi:hypothetical protein